MLTPKDYQYLYRITAGPTPLPGDCGTLCGSVCCRPGKHDELGIYLFPGEQAMFTRRENWLQWEEHDPAEHFFPASWPKPVYFVRCTRPCPREARPLACRFFPLAPHLQRDGTMLLIYETMDLPYSCPLITQNKPLQKEFVAAVNAAWQIMLRDRRIRDLVEEDSRYREEQNLPLRIVTDW
jgi:hypothetical protein